MFLRMDVWMYISVVAVGPIKECRKFIEALLSEDFGRLTPDNIFVNLNVKNGEIFNRYYGSAKEDEKLNLQQICAGKVLSLYEESKLELADIANLPTDLLQKIVNCIALTIPTTKEDVFIDRGYQLVRPSVKLNFDKQDQFITKINEIRPDLPSNWANDINDRRGMVIYNQIRDPSRYTDSDHLLNLCSDRNIDLSIVGRTACDYDHPGYNNHNKVFVIENQRVTFTRNDLPKEIRDGDHALIKTYGYLLQDWKEIGREERLEFKSDLFGVFKLIMTSRQIDDEMI